MRHALRVCVGNLGELDLSIKSSGDGGWGEGWLTVVAEVAEAEIVITGSEAALF